MSFFLLYITPDPFLQSGVACYSAFGVSNVCFEPLHRLRENVQGSCIYSFVGSHRGLLVTLGVLGGELLPAAPLQPRAGAPSGRGHSTCWTGLYARTLPQRRCPPCSTGMRHPLGMAPCAEAPHPRIRSVGPIPIRALPVHSLPNLAHQFCLLCFYCAP